MLLDVKNHDPDTAIVKVSSPTLDINQAAAFKSEIRPIVEAHRRLIIDMSAVSFLDSSGLGALLSALRAVKDREGEMRIFGLTRQVNTLIHLVRMHRVFAIFTNQDDALKGIGKDA